MNSFSIKLLRLQGGNELYINGHKADSAQTARKMKCADTGFQWGTAGTPADLTAYAICISYLGDCYSEVELIELSNRFKNDFVQTWSLDQDIDVLIDMHTQYHDYIIHFWDSAAWERYDY